MTASRLTEKDLIELTKKLPNYDRELISKTGLSLKDIAVCATKKFYGKKEKYINSQKVFVVRVTSGQGIIHNFAEAVKGILEYIGAEVFITNAYDVSGLAEGIEKNGGIAFLADDNRFVAINFSEKKIIDNTEATAHGYVTALEAMAGSLKNRYVLVIGGAGRVGRIAVLSLVKLGANVAVFDTDQESIKKHIYIDKIQIEKNLDDALKRHDMIFDASPAAKIIHLKHISPKTYIAAPGIPFGLTEHASAAAEKHFIHDVLEIGVATMFFQSIFKKHNVIF